MQAVPLLANCERQRCEVGEAGVHAGCSSKTAGEVEGASGGVGLGWGKEGECGDEMGHGSPTKNPYEIKWSGTSTKTQ